MYCFHKCFSSNSGSIQAPKEEGNEEACFLLQKLNGMGLVALFFFNEISKLQLLNRIKNKRKRKAHNWAQLN